MTTRSRSLLAAIDAAVLRTLCALHFRWRTANMTKDQIIAQLTQGQAITLFTALGI